jgi:uncharacterized protein YraI
MVLTALLLGVTMLLSACGPAPSGPDETALNSELQRIAQDYAGGGSLEQARAAVDGLSVANPRQWLAVKAEEAVAAGPGDGTAAIVELAIGLKAASGVVLQFAVQNGLVDPTPTPAPLARTTPLAIDAAAPAAPTAAPVAAGTATTTTLPAADVITATSEAAVALSLPTATPAPVVAEAADTTATGPVAVADGLINVRSGPGTEYELVGALQPAVAVGIVARSPAGDWWEVELADGQSGWVLGQLVQTSGDTAAIAIAADIPAPPPTSTPAPAQASEPAAVATEASIAEATATAVPEGPDFRLIEKRLWEVYENGGALDGPTVTCGAKRELIVVVLDAAGQRINGVTVQALLGAKESFVTGAQGKGDGQVEFVLGGGQDVTITRDSDGREVTADVAPGLTTDPRAIPFESLIAGGYCADTASCDAWVNNPYQPPPCLGHYSWTVTYQRKY